MNWFPKNETMFQFWEVLLKNHVLSKYDSNLAQSVIVSGAEVIAKWAESLQGRGEVQTFLKTVSGLAGADSVGLTRHKRDKQQSFNFAIFDKSAHKLFSDRNWHALSAEILGDALFVAREGTFWSLSEVAESRLKSDGDFGFDLHGHGVKEVLTVILENSDRGVVVLELKYRSLPQTLAGPAIIRLLAPVFSKTWNHRLPGLPKRPCLHSVETAEDATAKVPGSQILTHENPIGLSRSEFRICMLMRDGQKITKIADTMGVCEKTVRGHLAAIYAKADVSGQFALLQLLLALRRDAQGCET
ncbi:MAG: LuxR C-terminal-related transcriptional regulator, partial [Boseongicola sp.]|nr:LuxR C-terminal-related transcriptional regulator [Boseongicola sp.]